MATSPSNELADGKVEVRISGETYSGDLLLLKLACEELERKHSLEVAEGVIHATEPFLVELAGRFKAQLNAEQCTPTEAYLLWQRVSEWMDDLKKNTNGTQN